MFGYFGSNLFTLAPFFLNLANVLAKEFVCPGEALVRAAITTICKVFGMTRSGKRYNEAPGKIVKLLSSSFYVNELYKRFKHVKDECGCISAMSESRHTEHLRDSPCYRRHGDRTACN